MKRQTDSSSNGTINNGASTYLQAYERDAETAQPLAVFVTFYRGQEKAFVTMPFLVTDGMDPKSRAVPIRLSVPLGDLLEGEYLCQVTVTDPASPKAAFWQAPVKLVR